MTWFGRLTAVVLLLILIFLGKNIWSEWMVSFITAKDTARPADALLIEDWKYPHASLIRAALNMQSQGLGKQLFFVEYLPSRDPRADLEIPPYYHEMLDLYFKGGGVDPKLIQRVPVELKEPVTWNTAFSVMDTLSSRGYRSMILLTPWHHSRRSCDVYTIAGKKKGIEVSCKPADGWVVKETWLRSHAGMSAVFGEVIKRIYYILRIS